MGVQSFYIAEEEAYGVGISDTDFDPDHIYFHSEEYYEDITSQFDETYEKELDF